MHSFIRQHSAKIIGTLQGFDRLRLRGTLRWLAHTKGMNKFLQVASVLFKDFKSYATRITEEIRSSSEALCEAAGRPLIYLQSSTTRKEDMSRAIAERDGITEGLIAVLTCVEPCFSYEVGPNAQTKRLELRAGKRKCLHHYFYVIDPKLGFMHARLQTWFPFTILICLNGREWLAKQMVADGLRFHRQENCFPWISDFERAQKLMNRQLRISWKALLDRIARQVHPAHRRVFSKYPMDYYWSVEESEWASDIVFRSSQELADLYPRLIRHGIETFKSPDVMRFLGRKVPRHGQVNGNFLGEVVSDLKVRPEGMRVKHRVNRNAIKMYDKQGTILRVETIINDVRDMKVYRATESDVQGPRDWRRLRKGVADIHRRCQISQAANERYLASLASLEAKASLGELVSQLCRPVEWGGRRSRALNPYSPDDLALLEAINRGEFAVNGFRNRDLRPYLFPKGEPSAEDLRRQSSAITRKLRLLRAHGLIQKVPKTHRYVLSDRGRDAVTALLVARQADTAKLAQLAA